MYTIVEKQLNQVHGTEASLIFNSGYDANIGFFSSVPQRRDIILYDEYIHASIRDGIRLSNAKSYSFKHNDLEDLNNAIIYWYKNGDLQSSWTNSTIIGAGNTSKGQVWWFKVRVYDNENSHFTLINVLVNFRINLLICDRKLTLLYLIVREKFFRVSKN